MKQNLGNKFLEGVINSRVIFLACLYLRKLTRKPYSSDMRLHFWSTQGCQGQPSAVIVDGRTL